jgi:hypothetical protein
VTESDQELRRRFADLQEALLPQVHAADPATVQRRGRALRTRRALTLGVAAALLVAAFVAVERPSLVDHRGAEPVSPAPQPTTAPPSTRQPATTGAPTSTTRGSTTTTTKEPGRQSTSTTPPAAPGRRFQVRPSTIAQGQRVTVSGTGCNPGDQVIIIFGTEPGGGRGTAKADGSFQFSFAPTLEPRTTTTFDVYAACREGVFTPTAKLTITPATTPTS